MSVNNFVALILAGACFAGFILALDAKKRAWVIEKLKMNKK